MKTKTTMLILMAVFISFTQGCFTGSLWVNEDDIEIDSDEYSSLVEAEMLPITFKKAKKAEAGQSVVFVDLKNSVGDLADTGKRYLEIRGEGLSDVIAEKRLDHIDAFVTSEDGGEYTGKCRLYYDGEINEFEGQLRGDEIDFSGYETLVSDKATASVELLTTDSEERYRYEYIPVKIVATPYALTLDILTFPVQIYIFSTGGLHYGVVR